LRKIALIGTASSAEKAPYNDDSWEIWGVSARGNYVTRANRWFELHRLDGEPEDWADLWRKTMKTFTHDVELLMLYPENDLGPLVNPYPTQRISERFGTYFMTSSFAWMMALAIDELRPEDGSSVEGEIGIWGVEMEYATEYKQQRNGFRHFIDLARVLGIKVTRLASGGLSYEPVPYPLWQDDPLLNKLQLRSQQTKGKLDEYQDSLRMIRSLITQNKSAIEEIEKSKVKGYRRSERLQKLEKETKDLYETSSKLSKDITESEGMNEEQRWMLDYLTP